MQKYRYVQCFETLKTINQIAHCQKDKERGRPLKLWGYTKNTLTLFIKSVE